MERRIALRIATRLDGRLRLTRGGCLLLSEPGNVRTEFRVRNIEAIERQLPSHIRDAVAGG